MSKLTESQKALRKKASKKQAEQFLRYFKTGPGEYGEGDIFIGVPVRELRSLSKKYQDLSDQELSILLKSPIHEDRLFALIVLVDLYRREKSIEGKKKKFSFYLKHRQGINNWDLVDVSAHKILGDFCCRTGNLGPLLKLSASKRHWDRRMSMMATFAFIREKDLDLTYQLAQKFLSEKEDLMHKVSGWMLREAGKRDLPRLRQFIKKNGPRIPRTMLRYSIEKMSASERKQILASTRISKT